MFTIVFLYHNTNPEKMQEFFVNFSEKILDKMQKLCYDKFSK